MSGPSCGPARIVGFLVSVLLVGAFATVTATAAGAAKLQKACRILTPAEIEQVIALPIGEPDGSGSKLGCSYDIGEGIGSPGGGLVVTQYHTGPTAKSLWSEAKQHQQKVGKLYWDPLSGIASGFKDGRLFALSVTITGTDDTEHEDDALALVTAGLKNL